MPNTSTQTNTSSKFSLFKLERSDDALVTFGAPGTGGLSFHDVGFMPVNQATIAGLPLSLLGSDKLFIRYTGDGVQQFDQYGPTKAVYSDLHYELVKYTGAGHFGHAADGTPTATGLGNETVVAKGDLITGQLAFNAKGEINGQVSASFELNGFSIGKLDISVYHPAADIHQVATGLTLDGGKLEAIYSPVRIG